MKCFMFILVFILSSSCQLLSDDAKLEVLNSDEHLKLNNGVLYYQEKPFSGNVTEINNNEVLKFEIQYVTGRKHGYERSWYSDGSLAHERFYTMGKKSGIHQAWWKNGQQKFKYFFNTIGEYNGSVQEWYSSGQRYKDFNFENGKEVGPQQLWRSDGRIRANFVVKNGERFGLIGLKKCNSVYKDSKT